jgi:glycosyltransferase involved in cell wall biosynthesis
LKILRTKYPVITFEFNPQPKYKTIFIFLSQILFLLQNLRSAEICICQFGGYHSFFPALLSRIFRKPVLIINGGTDCVSFPSIHYGNFSKKLLGTFTKWSYQLATHLSPVHETLLENNYTYQNKDYPKQGIRYFCKNLKTPATIIHNGYDPVFWKKVAPAKKRSFLTVAAGTSMPFTMQLKGIDLILELAILFPDCTFTILGVTNPSSFINKPSNIILLEPVPLENLVKIFSEYEFYLQLSLSEGFPNALCEAMLCECIPIVSNVGAMPEIVGASGFILQQKNIIQLKHLIKQALLIDKNSLVENGRKRIIENYPETHRSIALNQLVGDLVSSKK